MSCVGLRFLHLIVEPNAGLTNSCKTTLRSKLRTSLLVLHRLGLSKVGKLGCPVGR